MASSRAPPPLREVANTAPYFHDGSIATLEEAVALMMAGGTDDPDVSPMLKELRDETVHAEDQKNMVRVPQGPLRRVPDRRTAQDAVARSPDTLPATGTNYWCLY